MPSEIPASCIDSPVERYCPHVPSLKQSEFLALDCMEAFYGGASKGGKSDALIMAALQYVDVPNYSALILRRTFRDLSFPDAIMDRAHQWFRDPETGGWRQGIVWDAGKKTFIFQCPGGGTSKIVFGYLEHEADVYQYQGATFQAILPDELTQYTVFQYTYLFSRLSRLKGSSVPLRMRSAGNPGGVGHDWVFDRLINPETRDPESTFIPASLKDNPHVDEASIREAFSKLDPVTRAQLEDGVWDVLKPGDLFDVSRIVVCETIPTGPDGLSLLQNAQVVRFWDLAGSAEPTGKSKKDPDYTASVKLAIDPTNAVWILDVTEERLAASELPGRLLRQAKEDGRATVIRIEQEGGSSGLIAIDTFKNVLIGFDCEGIRSTGSKIDRARPASAAVHNRLVTVISGLKTKRFLQQLGSFPHAAHDDCCDALSGAYNFALGNTVRIPVIHRGTSGYGRTLNEGLARRPFGRNSPYT